MATKKIPTPEEVEEKRAQYNTLIIRENYFLSIYPTTSRIHKITVAKQLRAVAAQLLALETYLDKHNTPKHEKAPTAHKFHQFVA